MKEKILIVGVRGFLGYKLFKYAPSDRSVIITARSRRNIPENLPENIDFAVLDILNKGQITEVFEKYRPDVVINCAAISLPDYAEDHRDETYAINVTGVENLIEGCRKINAKLIHLSTDYVFDGKKGNYKEDDPTDPVNYYGYTKMMAEKKIIDSDIAYLICRTAVLYGIPKEFQRKELFMSYYSRLKRSEKVIGTAQKANATLVDDLAQNLYKLTGFGESDIIHTASPQGITRYEYAELIAEIFGFDKGLIEFREHVKKRAPRPFNSSLNTDKLREKYGIVLKTQREGLLWIKNNYREFFPV